MPRVYSLLAYLCLVLPIPIVLSAPAIANGLRLPLLVNHSSASNSSISEVQQPRPQP